MKICKENVQAAFNEVLGGVSLTEWDRRRIVENALAPRRRPLHRRTLRRICTVAAAMALCVAFATGVLAAVPGFADQLTMLNLQTLALLKPIEQESTSSGIRMEVLAAINDGDSTVIYISLADETGQNRLDDTTTIRDMRITGLDFVSCDNVYRKPDGSVIVRLVGQSMNMDAGELNGKKVTLEVGSIQSQNTTTDAADTGYTVADIEKLNPKPALNGLLPNTSYMINGGGESPLYDALDKGTLQALKPTIDYIDPAMPWVTIRNVGIVDGQLHVLLEPDDSAWYNSVNFTLGDAAGNSYNGSVASVDIGGRHAVGRYTQEEEADRQEQILVLPDGVDHKDIHILRAIDAYAVSIDGSWSTTFTLQEEQPSITASCDLDMKPWHLTGVSVTSVGILTTGSGEMVEDSLMPEVSITLLDGTVLKEFNFASTTISSEEGKEDTIWDKSLFDEPIDTSQVASITINGNVVWQRSGAQSK